MIPGPNKTCYSCGRRSRWGLSCCEGFRKAVPFDGSPNALPSVTGREVAGMGGAMALSAGGKAEISVTRAVNACSCPTPAADMLLARKRTLTLKALFVSWRRRHSQDSRWRRNLGQSQCDPLHAAPQLQLLADSSAGFCGSARLEPSWHRNVESGFRAAAGDASAVPPSPPSTTARSGRTPGTELVSASDPVRTHNRLCV